MLQLVEESGSQRPPTTFYPFQLEAENLMLLAYGTLIAGSSGENLLRNGPVGGPRTGTFPHTFKGTVNCHEATTNAALHGRL